MAYVRLSSVLLLLATVVGVFGCASSRSTMLHRGENNDAWYAKRKLAGVPITVKVTTHMRVTVIEHHYRNSANDDLNKMFVDMSQPIRSVQIDPVKTDKIFTVDSRRPGAGSLTSDITFKGQYPDEISYNVEDETIAQVANLISELGPKGLFGTKTSDDQTPAPNGLVEEKSMVAVHLFEVDSPTLEQEVKAFLGLHLNNCHTCEGCPITIN